MSPSLPTDLPATATVGEYPQRRLNALKFGHDRADGSVDDRATSAPVKLGGCGRVCEGGHWVPIYDTGQRWSPGAVAVCGNAVLCDYCAWREQEESRERWTWHFDDWLAAGGQLLHMRLSFAHGRGDDLEPMLDDLVKAFNSLRRSAAWRDAGIVDWVRVLHLRWSPESGWYPHYHVVGFVRPGHDIDEAQALTELQGAWRDRVARGIGRRVSRHHGLFARVVGERWRALYAWHWADPDERDADSERRDARPGDDLGRDYDPRHLDDDDDGVEEERSWPLYRLAQAALGGDQVAWCAWDELAAAMKGVPVVRCSKVLSAVWKTHLAEQPDPEPQELGDPLVQVHASLWERARRAGATEMALELGRTHGVDAMAAWWARRLGVTVLVTDEDCPRLSARDGPALGPSPHLN